jgi:hypothetical protein
MVVQFVDVSNTLNQTFPSLVIVKVCNLEESCHLYKNLFDVGAVNNNFTAVEHCVLVSGRSKTGPLLIVMILLLVIVST